MTFEGILWIATGSGVWRSSDSGWVRETTLPVTSLDMDSRGALWAISSDDVLRRTGESWASTRFPKRADGIWFQLNDLRALDDGSVWVLSSETSGRVFYTSLFIYDDDRWQEHPKQPVGIARFLDERDTLLAYNSTTDSDGRVRIFAPQYDWKVLQTRKIEGTPISTMFWGPDDRLWYSTWTEAAHFTPDNAQATLPGGCNAVYRGQNSTALCASSTGGLVALKVDEQAELVLPPKPTSAAFDANSFGAYPTPIWARAPEAWAASPNDVWRAPLEHFDGLTWHDFLEEGDDFSAIRIEGPSPDDLWFLGERELRHWDGSKVTAVEVPSSDAIDFMALRVVTSTDVWLLRYDTSTKITDILRFDGTSWSVSYRHDVHDYFASREAHRAGGLAGTSEDLWAAFGQTVLHFDGTRWNTVHRFTGEDATATAYVLDIVEDNGDVWLLSRWKIFQWTDGMFVQRGYFASDMDHLAIDETHVYNFSRESVRRFKREKR